VKAHGKSLLIRICYTHLNVTALKKDDEPMAAPVVHKLTIKKRSSTATNDVCTSIPTDSTRDWHVSRAEYKAELS